jgi:putative toxin-antitoxin system antitoxin component (TIGR02293 family)
MAQKDVDINASQSANLREDDAEAAQRSADDLELKLDAEIISLDTRKRSAKTWTAEEYRMIVRLAKVFSTAEHVWRNEADAREWMKGSYPELGGVTPLKAAITETGTQPVEDILHKILFGLPV